MKDSGAHSFSLMIKPFIYIVLIGGVGLSTTARAEDKKVQEAKLFEVVQKNDLVQAKTLLESGVNPNARPPGERLNKTPLEVAVSSNALEMVELLLQFKADPLLEDENKDTALVYATDFPRMMALFRERGLSINTRNSEGKTPLLRMLSYTTKEKVAAVLHAGGDPDLADADGNTPLMQCAEDKDIEVFRLILARKVDINAQNSDGETALMKAVENGLMSNGKQEVLSLLLDAKADLEKRDWEGRTVLGRSVGYSKPDMALLLLGKGAKVDVRDKNGITPLMSAYDAKVVSKLIALGASAKETANDGRTALHYVAGFAPYYAASSDETYNQLETADQVIHALIKNGADVNARDAQGETPLHVAAKRGAAPTIQTLLKAGADINATDKKGHTPLDLAVESTDAGKVTSLLKAGADPRPHQGNDPAYEAALIGQVDILKQLRAHGTAETKEDIGRLLLAALSGYQDNFNPAGRSECIRELMKHPLDVNVRDSTQMTPLMWAAAADIPDAVELILKSGGDVAAKDNGGRDALSWAAATGALQAIPILLAHGAPTNATDYQKRSAADWAKICGQDKTLKLLQAPTSL